MMIKQLENQLVNMDLTTLLKPHLCKCFYSLLSIKTDLLYFNMRKFGGGKFSIGVVLHFHINIMEEQLKENLASSKIFKRFALHFSG